MERKLFKMSAIKSRNKARRLCRIGLGLIFSFAVMGLIPSLVYAAVPALQLASNIKCDRMTVGPASFLVADGYTIDIEASAGLTVTTGATLSVDGTTFNIAGSLNLGNSFDLANLGAAVLLDAQSGVPTITLGTGTRLGNSIINANGAVYYASTNFSAYNLTLSAGGLNFVSNQSDLRVYNDLLINGGTLTMNHANCDIDIDQHLTITSGTLIAPTAVDSTSFLVGGNWEVSGTGTFTPSSARVVMDTLSADTIKTTSSNVDDFYQLYIADGSTKFLQSDMSVRSNLVITSGTLDTDSDGNGAGSTISNINVGGAFTMSPGTVFNARTSTVTFDGSGSQSIVTVGNVFYNVVVNNNGSPGNVFIPLDINGNLTINDGTAAYGNSNVLLAGNLSVAPGAVLSNTAPTTFTFDGTTATTANSNGLDLGPVIINKTDTVAPATNNKVTLNGNLAASTLTVDGTTGQADTLDLASSGYTLTLTGNGTPLTVNSGATFNTGTSSVVKYASTATTGTTITTNVTYRHISFDTVSNTFTLGGSLDVDGSLTITSGTFATGGNTINLGGNWNKTMGINAFFTHGNGTVILDGADQSITGTTTFYNLTKTVNVARQLNFEDAFTYQIDGLLTLKGQANQLLTIQPYESLANLIVSTSTGTIDLDYLNALSIDSTGGLLMIAPNSTIASCVNWQTSATGVQFTWDGSAGTTSWITASNWDRGMIPAATSDIVIPSTTWDPTLDQNRSMRNLTIQTGGELSLAGFNPTLSGPTFQNQGTVKVKGTEVIGFGAGGAQMDTDSGTFEYVASGASCTVQDYGSTDYYDLKINKPSETALLSGSPLVVTRNITITAGTMDTDSNGNTAGGTISSIILGGSWSNSGTFTYRTSTVTFNGATTPVSILGNAYFNNLTINKSASSDLVQSPGSFEVFGDLIITQGTLDFSGSVSGPVTRQNVTIGTNGRFLKGTGTWVFNSGGQFYYNDTSSNGPQNLGNVDIGIAP